jgi:hypothetical protein
MILVSLVLKLFVSSRPRKLKGVLCIYVLLFHEGQAKNHLLCFSLWFEHTFDFHCFIFMSFVCVLFHVITWLLSFFYQDFVFHAHVLSSFDPNTQCLHKWSRLCRCMSPQKLFFRYHLPTRGQAGVKLGDASYVSNVSIIFDAPCLFLHHLLSVLLHFVAFLCIFQDATVLVPCFLLFLWFRKVTQEIFSELDETKAKPPNI